ncbi:MAG: asparagine synthase-related protein [Planctomycetota bacterium]
MSDYIEKVVNLMDPEGDILLDGSRAGAEAAIRSGDASKVAKIRGQFAILQQQGKSVLMARSIGRPMRFFLAKRSEGPCLIVAERIDEIHEQLRREGLADQFHPSYTRMVPAHHLMRLELVGCPDPNPQLHRFFNPKRNVLPSEVEVIGHRYISALVDACDEWLDSLEPRAPIGVLFSGGIDSGAVLCALLHGLQKRGETPQRLKAFTLRVHPDAASLGSTLGAGANGAGASAANSTIAGGDDADQANRFLEAIGQAMLLEVINADPAALDWRATVRVLEDYKPLDIESGTMARLLCQGIRQRYPDFRYVVDGDGGDENLKDYPIEDNPELTIRSVLNNQMLYQEGWGVDAVKHSLVYSGGQSRGHIRTSAPARSAGLVGFSPFALPEVIEVAEGIPFIEMCGWDHQRLYDLKGRVVHAGVKSVTGIDMPIFPKRRFQHGVAERRITQSLFPSDPLVYRRAFDEMFTSEKLSAERAPREPATSSDAATA